MASTLVIPIAFVVLASSLLWLLIGAKGHWLVKTVFSGAAIAFGLAVWFALESYAGWPTTETLPKKFRLNWAVVNEPVAIYVWASDVNPPERWWFERKPLDSPRAYQIPYSRSQHEQTEKALVLIRAGKVVMGEGDADSKADGQGVGGEDGSNGEGGFSGELPGEALFYELPEPVFPEKQ